MQRQAEMDDMEGYGDEMYGEEREEGEFDYDNYDPMEGEDVNEVLAKLRRDN